MLNIPDNWDSGTYYNLPLDEFMEVINYALKNGHTVCWDGDMSEKSYSDIAGIAVNATVEELANESGKKLDFTKVDALLSEIMKMLNRMISDLAPSA